MFSKFRGEVTDLVGKRRARLLEEPPSGIKAELALPCFTLVRKRKPAVLAAELGKKFADRVSDYPLIGGVEVSGPYVNFHISRANFVPLAVKEVLKRKWKYGSSDLGRGKKVIVEYPSVNIAKPMSVGHLRSANIGQSLYNIFEFLGYDVISDDHLGDWGTQFGKLLCAYKKWGKPRHKRSIKGMLELYVRFHEEAEKNPEMEDEAREWFRRLEKGNNEAVQLWKSFRRASLKEFRRLYKRLNLRIDYQLGESFYTPMLGGVIKEALEKGVAVREEGAVVIKFDDGVLIIQKSDGATKYETRDLATVKYRADELGYEKNLYCVGNEQKQYFEKLFRASEDLGYSGGEDVHVSFGLMSLPGGRMSTRAGRVVFLEDVIDKAVERALKAVKKKNPKLGGKGEVAEAVGIGAIKYADLSKDRERNVRFDWSMIDFEGNTGPYLQYTHARSKSVLRKSRKRQSAKKLDKLTLAEVRIAVRLSRFPGVVQRAADAYKPHHIANYLYELADAFNEYYHSQRIIGSDLENQRLALTAAVAQVLKNGLGLLGIEPLEEM